MPNSTTTVLIKNRRSRYDATMRHTGEHPTHSLRSTPAHADTVQSFSAFLDGTLKMPHEGRLLAAEMQGDYPITDQHGSILFQLLSFKALNPASPPPLVLNFDPHHDFYEDPDVSNIAVLSGTWAQMAIQMGLARVHTVLPCVQIGNQGGFGKHTWQSPQVVRDPALMHQIDYHIALEGELTVDAVCELKDLRISTHQEETTAPLMGGPSRPRISHPSRGQHDEPSGCTLAEYAGPIWLSIDYDFFSLRDSYHHSIRDLKKQFKLFRDYLDANCIYPSEILGYRSLDYLTLYSGERGADRWIARMDSFILGLRDERVQPPSRGIHCETHVTKDSSTISEMPG